MSEERLIKMEEMIAQLIDMVGHVVSEQKTTNNEIKMMNLRMQSLEMSTNHTLSFLREKSVSHEEDIFVIKHHLFRK